MRRGIFYAGIGVIVLGILIIVLALVAGTISTTIPVQAAGQLTFSPNMIGSGTVTLSWSGASSAFRLQVYQCTDSSCTHWQSAPLANGAGSSGSVSFGANGGDYYVVVAQGNANAIPASLLVSGLTLLVLVGIILAIVGGVVGFLGFRMKPKPRPVAAAAPEAPKHVPFSTRPFTDVQEGVASDWTPEHSERVRHDQPEPTGPVFFKPVHEEGEIYQAKPEAAAPQAGARPSVTCSYCGTVNESWILNCRTCRRPLSSTGNE